VRRLTLLLAVALLAGCGGNGASKVVQQTAENIRDIRSGVLHVKLLVEPHAPGASQPFGFQLDGPFNLGKNGAPPTAHLNYTQTANGTSDTATLDLRSNGGSIVTHGTTHELTPSVLGMLRGVAKTAGSQSSQFLPVQDWVKHAKEHSCGANDCVDGDLDVVKATNDLLGLARALGRNVPEIKGADADQLKKSVRAGTFELVTGKTDRLLRRLVVHLQLGLDVPASLSAALGSVVGATFTLDFGVDRPNG
jgi:hypothetical protein